MEAFANYAAKQLRTYKTPMYDLFADICDKVIDGDRDAIDVVEPFIIDAQMDIFREQNHLYISFHDENAAFREYGEIFDYYIDELTGDYNDYGMPYHFPKKFYDEVYEFFKYTDEGKKCMNEFNPNTDKIQEI